MITMFNSRKMVFNDLCFIFREEVVKTFMKLKATFFAATRDADGTVYIYMSLDKLTKNH